MILSHTHLSWKKPKGSSPVSVIRVIHFALWNCHKKTSLVSWAQGLHQIRRSLHRNVWWGPSKSLIEVVTTSTVRFSGCINTILIRYRTETPQTPEWGQRHSTRHKWQGQKICRFAMQNPLAPAENPYFCSLHGEACLLPSHMPILPNQYQSTPDKISWSLSSLWLRCDSSMVATSSLIEFSGRKSLKSMVDLPHFERFTYWSITITCECTGVSVLKCVWVWVDVSGTFW